MVAGVKSGGRVTGTPEAATAPAAAPGAGRARAPAKNISAHAQARARGKAAEAAESEPRKGPGRPRKPVDPGFPKHTLQRVSELMAYGNNARTHSPEQIAQIAASIREFGFTNPVLTNGKRGIIAGHGRVLAALELGMETVPVIELSHLTKTQQRAYILADNKLAEAGGWDEGLLALELGELRDDGFDLALTGFEIGDLKTLIGGGDDPPTAREGGTLLKEVTCPVCRHQFHV